MSNETDESGMPPSNMPPIPPDPPQPPSPPQIERIEVILSERVYYKGDKVGHIRTHIHKPHNIGQKITGVAPLGLELNHIWVRYCTVCHLAYMTELPNTPIQFGDPRL